MSKTKAYVDYILDLMRSGDIKRESILSKFVEKWQTSDRTFDRYLKMANEAYNLEIEPIIEQKAEIYQSEQIETFKTQIKTKLERLLTYQSHIDKIELELITGKTHDVYNTKDGLQFIERDLSTLEKNSLRKTLKELQSEISKIEGDYAPTKVSPTDKDGNDLKYNVFSGSLLDNLTN